MTPWLSVKGAGLVHSVADLARLDAQSLPLRPALAQDAPLPDPDMTDLSVLLARYYAPQSPPPLRRIPRYARFGLLAALRAMEQAGWHKDAAMAPETMLALGTAYSGVQMSMDFMDSVLDQGPRLSSPTAFSHAVNNMGAGLLSLLLDVRGSCQTISQFSLSFAGALQAAALALHGGRARRALVGAVDEMDPRYAHCLGFVGQGAGQCAEQGCGAPPYSQGAVFLCLEAAQDDSGPQVRVHWGRQDAADHGLVLCSGGAEGDPSPSAGNTQEQTPCLRLHAHYGTTPLAQALDLFLALPLTVPGGIACTGTDQASQQQATVELRRYS